MNAEPEVFSMKSWGNGAPGLSLSVPAGWAYTPQDGPDFDVHYFTNAAKDCTIALYVGMHPNLRAPREPEKVMGRSTSQILGQTVHWTEMKRTGDAGEFFFSEAIIEHVFAGKTQSTEPVVTDLSLHLMISATTAERANACKQTLTTLDLQP